MHLLQNNSIFIIKLSLFLIHHLLCCLITVLKASGGTYVDDGKAFCKCTKCENNLKVTKSNEQFKTKELLHPAVLKCISSC